MSRAPATPPPSPASQRIDKWLWFARLAKSRTLAQAMVEEGRVRVNREKALQPSRSIRTGDVLTVATPGRIRVLRVRSTGERRGPASEAQTLYEELGRPE
jgi:ribosome-associated heat shock protein Hsp15